MEKCTLLDEGLWPKNLKETPFPPKKLWVIGNMPDFSQKYLAIVGSRKFSSYGKDVCEHIIEGLRGYPVTIVSGLAIGIDCIAHKKALEVGLSCMAIPGSGLAANSIYPSQNQRLAERIVYSGGCLISEFDPDMSALPWMFPQRNRIMAGLCDAVLIIEAEEKSGTLITARLALDYNREVITVPHSIFSSNGKGANNLLKDGAQLVTSGKDVLEILGFTIDEDSDSSKQTSFDFKDLSEEESIVLDNLKSPQTVEELVFKIDLPIEKITQTISLLEIKNIIVHSGNLIRIK